MLIAAPVPQIDESPSSILMRAASLNALESVRPLLKLRGMPQNGPLQGGVSKSWRSPELYAKYMAALGITLPAGAGAYRQHRTLEGIRVYINDAVDFSSLMFRAEGSTFCPQCLTENPYLRRIWSLKLLDICPIHRCDLVQVCPQCAQAPNWDRGSPDTCNCKFDLSTCQPTFNNKGNPDEVLEAINEKRQYRLDTMSQEAFRQERRRYRQNARLGWNYVRY